MERVKDPNKGLLSPAGGKLHINEAESPFACAVREANEECGIISEIKDWELFGLITEKEYPGIGNLMIFMLEYKKRLKELPENSIEGDFVFVPADKILTSNIPETDKLFIWKFVLNRTSSFYCVHIDCTKNPYVCTVEQK